jgi:dTDP-4-dehydrorhamnose reductase
MMNRKILLIGKNGQLGWELQRTLATLGEVVAFDYPEIDLTHSVQIRKLIRNISPQLIINAAAYTNVDKAEAEADLAWQVNAVAPEIMAEEASRIKAAFIHYSTDYVFDGTKGSPYLEKDAPNPLNEYGKSKLGGEAAAQNVGRAYLILRTSWVYSMQKGGFVTKVLEWARQQTSFRVVDDQISNPTWARVLAEATSQVIAQGKNDLYGYLSEKAGLYHLAGGGYASRYEWAKAILDLDPKKDKQKVKEILPGKTSEFPAAATRPAFSALNTDLFLNTFDLSLPSWKKALALLFDVSSVKNS